MRNWTVATVKKKLPDVILQFADGRTARAKLGGRKLPFAIATIKVHGSWLRTPEIAWTTVAHSLNSGRPLRI